MRVRHRYLEEFKKQVVREALEGGNASFVARKYGYSSSAVHDWVRQYRDEVEAEMGKKEKVDKILNPETTEDWQSKYEKAVKLLGEKDLEIAILKDLVKKNHSTKN